MAHIGFVYGQRKNGNYDLGFRVYIVVTVRRWTLPG